MRPWKSIVLIGGILGVAGFFAPLLAYRGGAATGSVSAYQVVKGIDDVSQIVDAAKALPAADAQKIASTFHAQLAEYRTAISLLYAPAALLCVLGILAGLRRRFGRIAAICALLLGAINAGLWVLFYQVSQEHHDATTTLGLGVLALLVAGAAGAIAGLGGLVAPDRGESPL